MDHSRRSRVGGHSVGPAALGFLLMTGCRASLLETGFEQPPAAEGWTQVDARAYVREPFQGHWGRTNAFEGTRCVVIDRGLYESPALPVEPGRYYRLEFAARADGRAYWVADYYDAFGAKITGDHYSCVDASDGWVPHTFYTMARQRAAAMRLSFRPQQARLRVDAVRVAEATPAEVLAWADAVYEGIPPLAYVPPADRFVHLPRTRSVLERGDVLRVVILGDSIANDLSNSFFHLLLERAHPGLTIELVRSVRSGTGCWWYAREDRVEPYVVDHHPDLVIVAGVSHHNRVDPIVDMVRQVRARMDPAPEFLAANGAVGQPGAGQLRYHRRWGLSAEQVIAAAVERMERFYAELEEAGRKNAFATLDLRGAWEAYIEESPQPREWYQRDEAHANARGKQVIGRIAARFLTAAPARPRRSLAGRNARPAVYP